MIFILHFSVRSIIDSYLYLVYQLWCLKSDVESQDSSMLIICLSELYNSSIFLAYIYLRTMLLSELPCLGIRLMRLKKSLKSLCRERYTAWRDTSTFVLSLIYYWIILAEMLHLSCFSMVEINDLMTVCCFIVLSSATRFLQIELFFCFKALIKSRTTYSLVLNMSAISCCVRWFFDAI